MRTASILTILIGFACAASAAATLDYALELPAHQMVAFEVDLDVRYPGTLVIEADWSNPRLISFKVERPSGPSATVRRTGAPPQRLEIEVPPGAPAEVWTLKIRGLPSRHAASGLLRIDLPDSPAEQAQAAAETAPDLPPQPAHEPWEQPVRMPGGLTAKQVALFESVERLRALLIDGDEAIPDTCRWQGLLLEELAGWRDGLIDGDPGLQEPTREIFQRMVEVVGQVEALRTSDDPILTRREPAGPERRRAWMVLHRQRTEPVRQALDDLLRDLQHGYSPRLARASWPIRFLSCLMACERHFEERGRLGEKKAHYRQTALDQWDRILAAADSLARLTAL